VPPPASPVLRVGLASDLPEFLLPARGMPWTLDVAGARTVHRGPLTFRPIPAPPVYRIQVGAFSEEPTAQRVAQRFSRALGLAGRVVFSAERGLYLVRMGEFPNEAAARSVLPKAVAAGVDAFVSAEPSGPTALLLNDETGREIRLASGSVEITPPDAESFVECRGTSYRGRLAILVNPRGLLNVVNVVNVEDYLRGVVPAEMGPKRFGEVEALKAQAVAARTYALASRGGFAAEGYDLCATPKCQVYGGRTVEDPLTDAAVEATRGLVATYDGKLIQALFTSTCGGRTEDGKAVFASMDYPYLKSVVCGEEQRSELIGAPVPRRDAERSLSPLSWRGRILAFEARSHSRHGGRAAAWREALELAGVPSGAPPPRSLRASAVYPAIVSGFGLERASALHVTPLAAAYAAGPPDPARGLLPAASRAWDTFLRLDLAAGADLPAPRSVLSDDELDGLLLSVAIRLGGVEEVRGRFVRREGGDLVYATPGGERGTVPAGAGLLLARRLGGRFYPAQTVALYSGDPVGFLRKGGRVLAFWVDYEAGGATYEKASAWTQWVRRVSGRELMSRIAARAQGTVVRSVTVTKRGISGRAIEAKIVTDEATLVVGGFDLRQALELPELIFSVEKTRAPDGSPEFVFLGRGWGHGVGLCQNGAYGMALEGHKFDEILRHYYTGIDIAPYSSGM
jgi:stage II sporulation protein D